MLSDNRLSIAGNAEAPYLQVSLEVAREKAEAAIEVLEELGAMSVSIRSLNDENAFDEILSMAPSWQHQHLVALFGPETASSTLADELSRSLPACTPRFDPLEDRDWERAWMDQYVPQQITPQVWVVPSWVTPPNLDAVNLIIDPGLAFGTGTHPTTRMCLQFIAGMPLKGKRVLDYGCGSGILSVAALKLGASLAVATDLDPRALETCLENAKANECADRLLVVPSGNLDQTRVGTSFDLVMANILAPTLLSLSERLCSFLCANGVILLSGILEHQADEVEKAYQGLKFIRNKQKSWSLLVGTSNIDIAPAQ